MFPDSTRFAALSDAITTDLVAAAPEAILAAAVPVLLLARMVLPKVHHGTLALLLMLAATSVAGIQWAATDPAAGGGEAFTGLLKFDALAVFLRFFLTGFGVLLLALTRITGVVTAEDSADFATLAVGGTLGFLLMVSSNHTVMIFLAVEMATLPGFVLAAFPRGNRDAAEGGLKYLAYAAAGSAVLLYGLTLLTGRAGTGYLPELARAMASQLAAGGWDLPFAAGVGLTLLGLLVKLAAFPVFQWLPDVIQGARAEVGAILAVASKTAVVGLILRLVLTFQSAAEGATHPSVLPQTLGTVLAVVAVLTMTVGNLAAYRQTSFKRLLAYSTVAHAGYLLAGVAPLTRDGAAAVLYYLVAYLLANLAAFAVAAAMPDDSLDSARGLMRRNPALGFGLIAALLGLLGLPPLAGFAGKLQVFAAAYTAPGLGVFGPVLLVAGVLNTAISAGYYLRVLRVIGFDDPAVDEKGNAVPLPAPAGLGVYVSALAVLSLVVGLAWTPLMTATAAAVAVK